MENHRDKRQRVKQMTGTPTTDATELRLRELAREAIRQNPHSVDWGQTRAPAQSYISRKRLELISYYHSTCQCCGCPDSTRALQVRLPQSVITAAGINTSNSYGTYSYLKTVNFPQEVDNQPIMVLCHMCSKHQHDPLQCAHWQMPPIRHLIESIRWQLQQALQAPQLVGEQQLVERSQLSPPTKRPVGRPRKDQSQLPQQLQAPPAQLQVVVARQPQPPVADVDTAAAAESFYQMMKQQEEGEPPWLS